MSCIVQWVLILYLSDIQNTLLTVSHIIGQISIPTTINEEYVAIYSSIFISENNVAKKGY